MTITPNLWSAVRGALIGAAIAIVIIVHVIEPSGPQRVPLFGPVPVWVVVGALAFAAGVIAEREGRR